MSRISKELQELRKTIGEELRIDEENIEKMDIVVELLVSPSLTLYG